MNNKRLLILILLAMFCMGISSVSAIEDFNSMSNLTSVDESNYLNIVNDVNVTENLSKKDDLNLDKNLSLSQNSSLEISYLSVKSQYEVLTSSISVFSNNNGHTYHMNGYTFTVSTNQYKKINNAISMGKKQDWLDNGFNFKVKTNKFYTYKKPIYKTKKVTTYKWKYKKLSVSQEKYWSWEYKYYVGKTTNGWTCYKLIETDFNYGIPHKHYVYLKKKAKYKTTKKVKTGKYKKVKMRVYATIKYQGWSDYHSGPHYYYPWVDFDAMKNSYSSIYLSEAYFK